MNSRKISRIRTVIMTLMLAVMTVTSSISISYAAINEDAKRPIIDAKSAMIYCVNTDEILYSKNEDVRIEPWSTTKLMTSLLVVENLDMDQVVTVSKEAAEFGESTMNLKEGEKVTVEQLLYGTLILSGNDAAYALGETVGGGDIKVFIKMMNEKAKELGCTDTHFANPHGLRARDHYSTASDFIKIATEALTNETIHEIAGTKKYRMAKTNKSDERIMETHLDLLTTRGSGIVAGKTGYWEEDDSSVAFEYNKDGLDLIVVSFKTPFPTREDEDQTLIDFAKKAIVTLDATDPKESVGKCLIKYGEKTFVDTYPVRVVHAYPKDGEASSISTEVTFDKGIKAPIKAGTEVGTVTVYADNKFAGETRVAVKEDIEKGWILSAIYISNRMTIILGGILVLLILLYLLVIRPHGKKKRAEAAAFETAPAQTAKKNEKYTPKH